MRNMTNKQRILAIILLAAICASAAVLWLSLGWTNFGGGDVHAFRGTLIVKELTNGYIR